jgi:hypothetical protein
VTDKLLRQLERLEARATPSWNDRELMGRLYLALGRDDDGKRIFAAMAAELSAVDPPDYMLPTHHLQLGNIWRLAGEPGRAEASLRVARAALTPMARVTDDEKTLLLYTLLLLGDDDDLLAAGAEFAASAIGEWVALAVETVKANRDGQTEETARLLAEWDRIADDEPAAVGGRHPSARDLRKVLRSRIIDDDRGGARVAGDGASAPSLPSPVLVADGPVSGAVVGWWGQYVVVVDGDSVALYDTTAGRVAYEVTASRAAALAWDPASALFTSGRWVFTLVITPTGIAATMIDVGGSCRFSSTGQLLAVERGFDALIQRADGVELATGRAPVAIAPASDAFALTTDGATIGITTLDATLTPGDSVEIDQPCSTFAWFPSGDRLACAENAGQTVRTVAVPSGEVLDEAVLHEDDPIVAIDVAPSGSMYASVGFDGVLAVRDLDARCSMTHSLGDRLDDVAWDATSELIAAEGERGWLLATARTGPLDVAPASSLAWHPSERRVALGRDGHLVVLAY